MPEQTACMTNDMQKIKNNFKEEGEMSRIGRMPIAVPAGVTVDIAENNKVTVKGPKGTLERVLPAENGN